MEQKKIWKERSFERKKKSNSILNARNKFPEQADRTSEFGEWEKKLKNLFLASSFSFHELKKMKAFKFALIDSLEKLDIDRGPKKRNFYFENFFWFSCWRIDNLCMLFNFFILPKLNKKFRKKSEKICACPLFFIELFFMEFSENFPKIFFWKSEF